MMKYALVIAVMVAGCPNEPARDVAPAANEPTNVAVERKQLAEPATQFDERKRIRVATLRGEHSVIGTQAMVIGMMAEYLALTDAGRADINNKLSDFQMRLDEAGNQIEGLDAATEDAWTERDDAVREAMDKLEVARKAAWRALRDAPHVHPNAS